MRSPWSWRLSSAATTRALPKRWIVERCFAHPMRTRRLVRDFERRTASAEAAMCWSVILLMPKTACAGHCRTVDRRRVGVGQPVARRISRVGVITEDRGRPTLSSFAGSSRLRSSSRTISRPISSIS